tara:strand:- start:344 stop:1102 length:759 start_codon:yes stop_codon:yes gene_type:complete
MNYKIFVLLVFLIFSGCKLENIKKNINYDNNIYINKGFTIVYSEKLIKDKITKKKIDNRSLDIHHSYLSKGTKVKITNLLNNKSIVGNVSKKIKNLDFYNSIISQRISDELKINPNQPYIEIKEIKNNSIFLAKKSKTFEEEKNVANKAPVETISINDLSTTKKKQKKFDKVISFSYKISVADLYFLENARILKKRIVSETNISKVNILSISENIHRIILGPYNDISSLQKAFYSIKNLGFENIEIIKNEKI